MNQVKMICESSNIEFVLFLGQLKLLFSLLSHFSNKDFNSKRAYFSEIYQSILVQFPKYIDVLSTDKYFIGSYSGSTIKITQSLGELWAQIQEDTLPFLDVKSQVSESQFNAQIMLLSKKLNDLILEL